MDSTVQYVSTNILTISDIEDITGGSQADTFVFAAGGMLTGGTGTLDGAGGVNTLDYSANTSGVGVDLGAGTATGTGGVANILNLIGGQGNDALIGDASANTLTGGPGNDALNGGAGDDTYLFENGSGADTINEGAASGTDTLDFSAVTSALTFSPVAYTVADTALNVSYNANVENLIGGSGLNTLSYAGNGAAHTVTLTGAGSRTGFAGTASSLPGTFDNMNAFEGGSGSDTLNGLNAASTWTLDSADSQYMSGGRVFGFDATVEILNSGTAADTFELVGAENRTLNAGAGADTVYFRDGSTLNGHFDGGSGADSLSFSGNTTGRSIVLTALGTTDGFAGSAASGTFHNVNTLTGGSGTDSFTGLNAVSTFNLQSANVQYTSTNTLTLTGIENLIGGSQADAFTLTDGLIFTGSVDGQGGANTLDFSAFTTARFVVLTSVGTSIGFTGTANGITGGFANINTLTGSGATDALTGLNAPSTFNLQPASLQYVSTNTLTFANFENLIGGTDDDAFAMIGAVSFVGTLNGGAHGLGDTLDYSAYTGNVIVNLASGQATGTDGISNIEIIRGGTGINTITGDDGDNTLYGGPSNDRLVGGKGNDTYVLYDGWGTDEIVELPGEGDDTVDLSGITGATGELTFDFGAGTITITGGGNTVTHTGGNLENFVGGDFGNNFVFGAGVTIAGGVTGGAGVDTLNFSAYNAPVNALLTRLGSADGFAGTLNGRTFDNINALTGGSASDSLTGMNASATFTIQPATVEYVSTNTIIAANFETLTGGSDDDIFAPANTVTFAGTVNGGAGTDTLDYSAYTTAITVDLSGRIAQHIGALSGIENVTGGSANDILTGNAGPNVLRGGPGNDLLSGLGGNDILVGGAGNDTLIGGAGNDTFRFEMNIWGVDTIIELAGEGYDTVDFSLLSDNLDIVLGSVTVSNGANTATHSNTFIEYVIGGLGNDTFTVTGNQAVDLDGSFGDDTFIFANTATLAGTLDGSAGSDTLSFAAYAPGRDFTLTGLGVSGGFNGTATGIAGSFANINTLVGSAASTTDTLTGLNATSTFNLQPANTQYISTNTLAFSGVETLQGGSGSDTFNIGGTQTFDLLGGAGNDGFVFADTSRLLGTINGQTGSDTLDFSAYSTPRRIVLTGLGSQNGFAGGDYTPLPAITGGFDNFNTIMGSSAPAGGDILVGLNLPGEWVVGNISAYTANPTLTVSGFETLVGGDAADRFTVSGIRDVTLVGGAGDDIFVLNSGAQVLGSINGQGGNDTLEYGLMALPPYDAGTGTATGVRSGIFSIENFTLTMLLPVFPPALPVVVLPSGISESTQGVASVSPLYMVVYTLVTIMRPGEPVPLHPLFINILVVGSAAQVMLSAGSGAVANIITGTVAGLPSALPGRYRFVASLNVDVLDENSVLQKTLPTGSWMSLAFAMPDNDASYSYVLLYWDEVLGEWVEIPVEILRRGPDLFKRLTYLRYWDEAAGDWTTSLDEIVFWDAQFSTSLGAWVEVISADVQPTAVATANVNFTGIFVLVTLP